MVAHGKVPGQMARERGSGAETPLPLVSTLGQLSSVAVWLLAQDHIKSAIGVDETAKVVCAVAIEVADIPVVERRDAKA